MTLQHQLKDKKKCFNITCISLAWYMIISPRRMIVERLIRHFRANEYRDSWKRATTLKPNKTQHHDIKSHSYMLNQLLLVCLKEKKCGKKYIIVSKNSAS